MSSGPGSLAVWGGTDKVVVYNCNQVSMCSLLNTIFHIDVNKMHGKTFSHMVEVIRDFCEKVFPSGLAKILEL